MELALNENQKGMYHAAEVAFKYIEQYDFKGNRAGKGTKQAVINTSEAWLKGRRNEFIRITTGEFRNDTKEKRTAKVDRSLSKSGVASCAYVRSLRGFC